MSAARVFVETNFLFAAFRLPSKRDRNALALRARFEAGDCQPYVPYLCFQEAWNLIGKSLPRNRCDDLVDFLRAAASAGTAAWDYNEVKKFLDAAAAEVGRTKAVYRRELEGFAAVAGDGVLHGTKDVFDFLESLDLDDDALKYNDRLILSSVLRKARELKAAGASPLYFVSTDKSDLQPTPHRPKMSRYYDEAGLAFVPNFELPDASAASA